MAKKEKYYVVWQGRETGIFTTWSECEAQVKGAPGARYKSFSTLAEAQAALEEGAPERKPAQSAPLKKTDAGERTSGTSKAKPYPDIREALAVDAACSGNPGAMEYRGVHLPSGKQIFHFGPVRGTNNIGEFLAIVHALALLEKQGRQGMTIFSDSRNALLWVKTKKCKTTLKRSPKTEAVWQLIERAEYWLQTHKLVTPLIKWETRAWGEIPADFGRK